MAPRKQKASKSRKAVRHFIQEWRLLRGLTQEQLGERIDRSYATVSRIESGAPYVEGVFLAIADALNVEPADLLRPPPSGEEAELIDLLRHLKPDRLRLVLNLAKTVAAEDGNGEPPPGEKAA